MSKLSSELSQEDQRFFKDLERNERRESNKKSCLIRAAHYFTALCLLTIFYFKFQNTINETAVTLFDASFGSGEPAEPIVTIFEIQPSLPHYAKSNTTVIFYDEELVNGLVKTFKTPKNFEFDGAYLTLNFTNTDDDTEKVNVVEITIGDHPVWRSSTPYGRPGVTTVSSTTKDISKYISLLDGKNAIRIHLIEGDADRINVSLALTLTKESITKDKPKHSPINVEDLFNPRGPAHRIIALSKENGTVFDLSKEDKFEVKLPKIKSRTTAAKLELFASAGKEETEFFKNDNDPIRFLNVFINKEYVTTIAPKATLYHPGSIASDAARNFVPVVDFGNFVGLAYEIDLINFLPLLWDEKAILEVQAVSPVNDVTTTPSFSNLPKEIVSGEDQVAAEWYLSGNLHLWENDQISHAKGKIQESSSSEISSGSWQNPPSYSPWQPITKTEKVKIGVSANHSTSFKFTLKNNSTLFYVVNSNLTIANSLSKVESSSKKTVGNPYAPGGTLSKENINLSLANKRDLQIDIVEKNKVSLFKKSESSSLPVTIAAKKTTQEGKDDKVSLSANIDSEFKTKVNGKTVHKLKVKENLVNNQYVGPISNLKYETEEYKRAVQVIKGRVIDET
ncbi:uncharacterized protein RJT20DRAFT_31844 [Scheffersomyces xylosifermentans]|uniref:uncharacterized protein n=1 Tax=Scheffersomyces xylosifermentans TaxID=1304137 RepID=UPI00315C7159